jgi:dynactin-4
MFAGKTYPFHLALTNPLYDPIQVRLSVQRMHVAAPPSDGSAPEKARRPPFALSLPTSQFSIAAFAEAWEYEDDEDMFSAEDEDLGDAGGRGVREKEGRGKTKTVGVLEKRANVTVVGGEVVIGKEARGSVKVRWAFARLSFLWWSHADENPQFNMLVSYTYRSDDLAPSEGNEGAAPSRTAATTTTKPPEVKTFAFYTVVDLGPIIPREESKAELDN